MTARSGTARIRRILLISLALSAAALGGLYLFGRPAPSPEESPEASPAKAGAEGVVASSEAFDFTQSIEGQPVFSIHGDGFSTGRDARVDLLGVRIELYRDGTRFAIASDRATYDPNTKEADLSGGATLEGEDGLKVRSPKMSLTRGGRLLVAEGPVGLEQAGRWLGTSTRLEFDVAADLLKLDGPVRLESAPGSPNALAFETSRLEYDRRGRLLSLPETLTLSRAGDRLQAGNGELFLAEDEKSPVLLSLRGGVAGTILEAAGDSPARRIAVQATRLSLRFGSLAGQSVAEEATLEGHGRDLALVESIGDDAELIQGLASRAWLIRFAAGRPSEADSSDPVHFAEYRRGVEEAVRSGRADSGRIEFGADGGVARIALSGGVVLTDSEFKAWGDRALFDVPTGRAEILGPTARTESARGDLAAPHLVYVRSTGVLTATGGVRAVLRQATGDALGGLGWSASDPVQVEAAEATLTDRPRGFSFRESVRAWQGKNLLLSAQLRGEEEAGRLSAAGGVKSFFVPEDGGGAPVEIASETLAYQESTRQLVYAGSVTLRQEGRRLSCKELRADLDADHRIRRMTGTGDVRLQDPAAGREVEGESAEYDADSGSVLVTGSPVTLKDAQGTVLKGKRLQYEMKSGAAKMLGGES
jgi:lipopolysaccharide export system protein LptA